MDPASGAPDPATLADLRLDDAITGALGFLGPDHTLGPGPGPLDPPGSHEKITVDEGGGGPTSAHHEQIFSDVVATVSPQFLRRVGDGQRALLQRLRLLHVLCAEDKENDGACVLRGTWHQLEAAHRLLELQLATGSADSVVVERDCVAGDGGGGGPTSMSDAAVTCDIIQLDRLSVFAMEHPRRARFPSLLSRQAAAAAVKDKYRAQQRTADKRRSKAPFTLRTVSSSSSVRLPSREFVLRPPPPPPPTPVSDHLTHPAEVGGGGIVTDENHFRSLPHAAGGRVRSMKLLAHGTTPSSAENRPNVEHHQQASPDKKSLKHNYEELTPFKFFCKSCSFKTKRESHYARHLLIHDKVKTLYRCEVPSCTFSTIRLSHLRRHVAMSHSQSTYDCDQCTYRTDELKLLARHMKLRHRPGITDPLPSPATATSTTIPPAPQLQCQLCPYTTIRPHHYKRHERAHRVSKKPSGKNCDYLCGQCRYKTHRKEHFNRHMANVHHPDRRPYLCDFCGKAFKRPDALKQHKVTHGGTDATRGVQFKCGECSKKCRSAAHLAEHVAVHSSVRAFLCEICGASFKTRSVQRKHVVTIHKNPRAFPCPNCYKRFNTNYALQRHLRLHLTGEADLEGVEGVEGVEVEVLQPLPQTSHSDVLVVHPLRDDDCLLSGDQPGASETEAGPAVFVQTSEEGTTAMLYLTSEFTGSL